MPSPWFVNGSTGNSAAPLRLFCFPFAGGSGHEFRTWGERLPEVEVFGVHYPGRTSRYTTPPIDNMAQMVAEIQEALSAYQDKPFAFFGHSLGALIAYELTYSLGAAGMAGPKFLFVSACDAPQFLPVPPQLHTLPDEAFIQAIREIGGTPEAVLQHKEILGMMLPILRADLKLLETYQYQERYPLTIPIYAAGGGADRIVSKGNILGWEAHTADWWEVCFFKGGHFYFREEPDSPLFGYLQRILSRQMPPA